MVVNDFFTFLHDKKAYENHLRLETVGCYIFKPHPSIHPLYCKVKVSKILAIDHINSSLSNPTPSCFIYSAMGEKIGWRFSGMLMLFYKDSYVI